MSTMKKVPSNNALGSAWISSAIVHVRHPMASMHTEYVPSSGVVSSVNPAKKYTSGSTRMKVPAQMYFLALRNPDTIILTR